MTDAVQAALIAALPGTAAGLAAVATTIWSGIVTRRATHAYKAEVISYKLEINSRMDELMRLAGVTERALGKAEGIEQERGRRTGVVD